MPSTMRAARTAVVALLTAVLLTAGLITAASILAAAPAAAADTISLTDYAARLEAARTLAESDAPTPSPAAMAAVRRTLGLPLAVSVGRGVVHLPTDPVLEPLPGASSGDFRQAADRLAALEDAAKAAEAAPPADRARIAAALASAFDGINTKPGVLNRLRHDAWAIIVSIWQRLATAAHKLPIPMWLVEVLAVTILAAVMVGIVHRLRYVVPERGRRAWNTTRVRATDWHRLAEEALARGDYRAALRARYGALLAALAARGVIPEVPSLTAGECRQAVARRLPEAYPVVERATIAFEASFFGRAPVHREEVDAMGEAEAMVASR